MQKRWLVTIAMKNMLNQSLLISFVPLAVNNENSIIELQEIS
jgi:hypothetical protein